ncbi:MAG: hypothetical protein JJV89_02310 [Desulfosarcina sp.]|nr:hypothetical protein [Desulfobacterales bacterium]
MGIFSDQFVADYEGHTIEFEAYSGGCFSYACSLLVDNEKVDSARYGTLFSYFSLRHNLLSDPYKIRIKVEIRHTFHTVAKLFVNKKKIPFKRMV